MYVFVCIEALHMFPPNSPFVHCVIQTFWLVCTWNILLRPIYLSTSIYCRRGLLLGRFFVGFLIRTFLMRFSLARQTCPGHSKNFAFNKKWISLCMLLFMFILTPKYLNLFTYSKKYWPTFRNCFIYCTSGHYQVHGLILIDTKVHCTTRRY